MSNLLPPLEALDVEGDNTSMGNRWEKWKRALNIYLDAAEVSTPQKKRATLLHFGGTGLQEIFFNLPGANVDIVEGVDVFKTAIEKLNDFFLPKQNHVYERHVFRLIKQEGGEKFERFLVKLRKQADKCNFDKKEDHLIDQITEKCISSELRKKILTIGDSITLEKIIYEANTLEVVNDQLDNYETKNQEGHGINAIHNKGKSEDIAAECRQTPYRKKNCGRCGSYNHLSNDSTCPARGKACHFCGKIGHYRRYCKTAKVNTKRKFGELKSTKNNSQDSQNNKRKKIEVDYVFNVDDDAVIACSLGGIKTEMLVDSGCKVNLITQETWEILKGQGVSVRNQISKPKKTLLAYGSDTPLDVRGSFETSISIGKRAERATVYVIPGGTRDILGKDTATRLGVLKIGVEINGISGNDLKPFPKLKDVLIEIPIDETIKPVSQPYRRIPIPLEEKVESKIHELLELDIIEEVQGPSRWVSPMVPILKESGELRLCVDMRRANSAIMRENHPLPCMEQILPKIGKAKFFSKLDVKDAFHQLELEKNCRHITTFITAKGLFQYKRLMFGISCAPEIFQKVFGKLLVKCDGVVNFIDDILIFGDSEEQHDMRLQRVLETLKINNVLLNENKCILKVAKVSFLGHELTPNGVKPLKKYIESISNFRIPATIEELQSFLGLTNYVNKWIPHFATKTEPLKELLRKKLGKNTNISPYWGNEQDKAFQDLKTILSNVQSLGYYDVRDKTQVIADASPVGLGAILIQMDSKGSRIIAYGNRTLTECERKYSQTEKEALALVWSVEHFNIFLFGKTFDLITDHKPLEILFGPKARPCARIERWVLRLQSYKYTVIYKPGKMNIADPLSRLCVLDPTCKFRGGDEYVHQIVEQARPKAIPLTVITQASATDREILNIKKAIYEQDWDDSLKGYKIFEKELCFYDDILLRGNRIVIPLKLRKDVLDAAHEGHPGIVAMKGRLRSKVWWPRIDRDAENLIKSCKSCTLVGLPTSPFPMKRRELPLAPWVDVAMDLLGPLPNHDYLLVVVDYYSRYKEVKFTKYITSLHIINLLKEIFSRLGYPASITVDNGRQFVSEEFRSFCEECNITLFNTIPYWPQQNGEVERQNRDILKRLKISHFEKKDLKESLWEYLIMYNSTPHSTTGKSPSELFYNRQNRDKIPSLDILNYGDIDMEVRDRDKGQKERGKQYGDRKRRATDTDINEGDKVYIKNTERTNKLSLDFNPTSHTVESSHHGDVTVRNDQTGKILRRNVVHLKKVEGKWTTVQEPDPMASGTELDEQRNVDPKETIK